MSAGRPGRLGEYLDCSSAVIDATLAEHAPGRRGRRRKRLGELLLDAGFVTPDGLASALHAQRIARMKGCELFTGLSDAELSELASLLQEVSLEPGEQFIHQDQREKRFYFVATGTVEVFRRGEDGSEIALSRVGFGEPVGEMAYFSDGRRTASARAAELCELLQFDFADLNRAFEIAPRLAVQLLSAVSGRLNRRSVGYADTVVKKRSVEESLRHVSEFLSLTEAQALDQGTGDLIQNLVHSACTAMHADRGSIFLLDAAKHELWSIVLEGEATRTIRFPADAGIAGWVLQHGDLVHVKDAHQDTRFNRSVDDETGYRTRNILCGPVRSMAGDVIGVAQVINKLEGEFDDQDERMFRAFCSQAAIAVENHDLYTGLADSHRKLAIILDVATAVNETLDLPRLIHNVVGKIAEALDCDRSSFFVLDETSQELWSMVARDAELAEIRIPISAGLAGHVARTGEVLNIADAYEDPRFHREVDRATSYRTRSVLCVPVMGREGNVIGVTQAINKNGGEFQQEDVELLRAISSQIAIAVQKAQLHARTVEMKNYLENVQQSISSCILTTDSDLRLVTVNRAAGLLLGLDAEACIGRDARSVLGEPNRVLVEIIDRVAEARVSVADEDISFQSPSGKDHTVNVNVLPLTDHEGAYQGLVIVLEDITQEKRIKSTLTRYMAKDIVDQMLADPEEQRLGGNRNIATVLFSDIRGFTTISEGLTAERTMDFLNEYFTLMVDEVFRGKGVLDKFLGDGLMAVFGVPYVREDDSVRAVRTALRMLSSLDGLNAARRERGEPPVRIGVGINTGEVISGNMGSEKRMEFTVIGDSVNTSSRLEGLNKQYGTQILISESTREGLGDEFVTRPIDTVLVKGKTRPVTIYEVLGDRDYQLTPAQEVFREGFACYIRGDFRKAIGLLRQASSHDDLCAIFQERCEAFLQEPPGDDWDGVWRAISK